MRSLFIFCLVIGVRITIAQDFRERLVAIQKEYAGIETAHIMMTIEVFENKESKTPYFKEVANIKRQDTNYHYQLGNTHMLMNTRCMVLVDKGSKEIVYANRTLEDEKKIFRDPFEANLDSILLLYDKPTYLGNKKDGDHYSIRQRKGEIRQLDLYFDSENNRLNGIEYRYEDDHYVAIKFTLFEKQPVFPSDTFSERNYVINDNGKLKAARPFLGYHVEVVDGKL